MKKTYIDMKTLSRLIFKSTRTIQRMVQSGKITALHRRNGKIYGFPVPQTFLEIGMTEAQAKTLMKQI